MERKPGQYSDRPLSAGDAAYVVALHRLPHAAAFLHCPTEIGIAELAGDESVRARVVVDAAGRPAGFIVMSVQDGWLMQIHGIVAERPRSGAGRSALREALRWAFDDVGAHRVWLEVTASNANARRLYESEGFVHEGTYRDGYRTATGDYQDLAHYGILKHEWRALS